MVTGRSPGRSCADQRFASIRAGQIGGGFARHPTPSLPQAVLRDPLGRFLRLAGPATSEPSFYLDFPDLQGIRVERRQRAHLRGLFVAKCWTHFGNTSALRGATVLNQQGR